MKKWLIFAVFAASWPAQADSGINRADYGGEWLEDGAAFWEIAVVLGRNNVRGCGQFEYKPSSVHSNEYLVRCTRDGETWREYVVWPKIEAVEKM